MKTMTAREFSRTRPQTETIWERMEAYHQYAMKARVDERLSDEAIGKIVKDIYPNADAISSNQVGKVTGMKRGAKWAREQLLKSEV